MTNRRLLIAFGVLVTLNLLDLWTTYVVLGHGGREGNPVGRMALGHGFAGLVGMKVAILLVTAAFAYATAKYARAGFGLVVVAVVATWYCAVVASNFHVIAHI